MRSKIESKVMVRVAITQTSYPTFAMLTSRWC